MRSLEGQVAVVAGGTRGGGRGIAVELGRAGATVYVTGRSVRGRPSPSSRPETIEETADLVDAAGGTGLPLQVDHTDPGQVDDLFTRVRDEQGGLDVLVNDVWGGDALTAWGQTFWKHDLENGLLMQRRGVFSHLITSHRATPLLVERGRGVIFEITDGIGSRYRGNLYYDLAKTCTTRLAVGMAEELQGTGVSAIAVTPGFMRSEAVLDHFGLTEDTWASAHNPEWVAAGGRFSETPRYLGRAVAALAADPHVDRYSGQTLASGQVARMYRFTDDNGTQPDMHTALEHLFVEGDWPAPELDHGLQQ